MGNTFVAEVLELPIHYLWFALVISVMSCYFQIVLDYYRIREKLTSFGLVSCSFAVVNFAVTMLFVVALKQGWVGRIYAQLACGVLYGLVAFHVYFRYRLFIFK